MKRNSLACLLLFFQLVLLAQERQPVAGKVFAGSRGISDVLVVNFSAQAETRTDSLGHFKIKAQVGDLLILTDRKIETRRIRYTPDLVNNSILMLEVRPVATELDEVVINRSKVTSQSLGIPMGKKYTPAERRLKTAGGFDPVFLAGAMPGVGVSVDAIINAINGRTKKLKKELKIEQRERLLEQIWENYTKSELAEKFKIPFEYTDGFAYYVVENDAFAAAMRAGNKDLADLHLASLSVTYLELMAGGTP
jgi:hypothetical protein